MANAHTPVARTPLHHWHTSRQAKFSDRDGWQVVDSYGNVEREVEAAGSGLGLVDISAFAKMSVRGPGVAALVSSLVPGEALKARGAAVVAPELRACRLSDERLLLLQTTAAAQADWKSKIEGLQALKLPCFWMDVTSAYAGFVILGPRVEQLLPRLTQLDVRQLALPVNACAETALAGVEALLVRVAETCVPSLRIYVAWDLAEFVWERILESGRDLQIAPVGLRAFGQLEALGIRH